MSEPTIARFPIPSHSTPEHDPAAAEHARQRIAALPNLYISHATPVKEDIIQQLTPVSAATGPIVETPLEVLTRTAVQVAPRTFGNRARPILAGLMTFVMLFVLFKAPIFLSQFNYLSQSKPAAVSTSDTGAISVPPNPIVSIPKINVNAPVIYATDNSEAAIQKDLESGVVHYANTAVPGEPGNAVIFGHSSNDWWEPGNFKFVFVLLDKLQVGDTFTANYQSRQYVYQVTETKVVEPTDTSVLASTGQPEMTLITCTPPGTSWKRLVVRAKQISPKPGLATASPSKAQPQNVGGQGILPSNSPGITETLGNWWQQLTGGF